MKRIRWSTATLFSFAGALLLLFAGSGGAPASPPSGTETVFTGRVLEDATGDPIAAAQVMLAGTTYGTLTGLDGRYELTVPREDVPGDGARLVVRRMGYESAEVRVGTGDESLTTDIRLRPATLAVDAITATGLGDPAGLVLERRQEAAAGAAAPFFQDGSGWPPSGPDWNRDQYAHIAENTFLDAILNPVSTFSIDVDRASYSNVRRFLREGRLPPRDAVRIEEMVNYFPYEYATPEDGRPFAVTTELGRAPWRPEHLLLRIGLASPRVETDELPPNNLVFLIDVSGSMAPPDRLPLIKRSFHLLVQELRPADRVAIVVYAGAAGLVLPPTPGSEKARILDALDRLEAGGSTAGGAGLRLAYRVARESHLPEGNNRIILATDGDFNVGESSDSEMIRLVEEMRGQGTYLTVLGVGRGNFQSEKMRQLAQHGNGNFSYLDSLQEARKVLIAEMGGTLLTVAQDVKLQVEFNPSQVAAYRLIGYENRLLAPEDFNDDARDAGELGAGHTVTALYEIVPHGVDTGVEVRGTDPLRYRSPADPSPAVDSDELAFVRARYKEPGREQSLLLEHPVATEIGTPSIDLHFAAAVAGFGMLLRESEHRGSVTADQILSLASEGIGEDRDGIRSEFIQMVHAYRGLAGWGDGDGGRDGR